MKLKELEQLRRDNHELKAQREKQQVEFKELYESKQELYEKIMAVNDQLAKSKSETKEKILSLQFTEKEKDVMATSLEDLKK